MKPVIRLPQLFKPDVFPPRAVLTGGFVHVVVGPTCHTPCHPFFSISFRWNSPFLCLLRLNRRHQGAGPPSWVSPSLTTRRKSSSVVRSRRRDFRSPPGHRSPWSNSGSPTTDLLLDGFLIHTEEREQMREQEKDDVACDRWDSLTRG